MYIVLFYKYVARNTFRNVQRKAVNPQVSLAIRGIY